ncbi:response regulator [Paenibacillaceae bacterium WGS1546]|uniref:response regulator transcription factor n=1 Tax=Cohnella sp. WGS1546 TaxID=3366810 RepID=UPI00372D536E
MQQPFAVRILVVEDEIGVRRSLIGKLRGIELPIEIAGEAENAEQALDMMEKETPDIVLLDMRMPGMGGYRFLPILQRQFPSVKTIILSGYSDFEYVLQSLRSGAVDYLTKPVIKEELEKALQKTIRTIRAEQERSQRDIATGLLLNQAVPLLKHQIMNRILKPMSASAAAEKLSRLGIRLEFPRYAMFVARISDYANVKAQYMQDAGLVFFVFENIAGDSLALPVYCFPREGKEGEYVVLLGLASSEAASDQSAQWRQPIERLLGNLRQYGKFGARILVTPSFSELQAAGMAYRQAEERLNYDGDSEEDAILFLSEGEKWGWQADAGADMALEALEEAIVGRNVKELQEAIKAFFDKPAPAKHAAAAGYYALDQIIDRLFVEPEPMRKKLPELAKLLRRTADAAELKEELLVLAVQIGEAASKRNQGEARQMIQQAQKYIDECYFEEITLEALSKKFYLNRTYFSELFKNETGWTFKKYLNHVRVEKAKQLLVDHELRPSVVSELVGMKDPVYFTVLFKKLTGYPPGEYQKRMALGV